MRSISNFKLIVVVVLGLLTPVGLAQERFQEGDLQGFTRSPTEHIINSFEGSFSTRAVSGVVVLQGVLEPISDVLFEVRGPGKNMMVHGAKTDRLGRFKLKRLPAGDYTFKVTLNGFQSVVGKLTVLKRSKTNVPIRIELAVGV